MTTPHGWSLENNARLRMYEKLDRSLFRFMDMVCPLSSDLVEGITKCADGKIIRHILNGVDIDEVQSAVPADKSHSDSFSLGYIGQLIERKDLCTLISAMKLLCDAREKIRLTVIGDGPKQNNLKEEALRQGISEQIEFMGFKPDAITFLKTFDAFVLPSRMEGIPRCIMEAMAATVPVIVSDIPGNRDLVIHQKTGLLFSPGNSRDLADKIVTLMRHPEDAKNMAIRAREKVEAEFSSRKMAHEYTNLYFDLLGKQHQT
jgi:glycosyltransferase involved in cell wall biosynthesis